jgi:hypothetical protein
MLRLSNRPPEDRKNQAWPLLRVPTTATLKAAILQPTVIGVVTHFYGGRTLPCQVENCKACQDDAPTSWHSYTACQRAKDHDLFLLELTAAASEALFMYEAANPSLRGCLITCSRPKQIPNGRIVLRTEPLDLSKISLPEPPNVVALLCKIWRLPPAEVTETINAFIAAGSPHPILSRASAPARGNGQALPRLLDELTL